MKNTALITGASSGIGKEFAKIHASKGRDLVIVARREQELNNLKKELEEQYNVQVLTIAKDLTAENATEEIVELIKEKNIKIDYLINNAGFGGYGNFHERNWATDEKMIHLNIIALTALTRFILPSMVERRKGKILNISSTASFMPGPLQAVYFATKAYVTSFSQAIAEELRNTGVTVTALCPGATKTEFADTANMGNSKLFKGAVDPNSVAEKGYNAMEKGKLVEITEGSSKFLVNIALPFMPRKMVLSTVRKMQENN